MKKQKAHPRLVTEGKILAGLPQSHDFISQAREIADYARKNQPFEKFKILARLDQPREVQRLLLDAGFHSLLKPLDQGLVLLTVFPH